MDKKYISSDIHGYFKDSKTGFVINTNIHEKFIYENSIKNQIKTKHLEDEIAELKKLLTNILKEK